MAWYNNLERQSFPANADMTNYKFRVVELLSTGKVDLADLGKGFGIIQNVPLADEMATVATKGQSKAIAGGTVAIGDWVRTTSGGWVVKANSGDLSGVVVMGQVLASAASGAICTIDLNPQAIANVVSGSLAGAMP